MQFDHDVLKKIRLEDLYVFRLLCKLKNYSKVAESIGKSQGTISIEINRLEENLNVKLIERTSKTFKITKFGKIFLDFCENTLNDYENLILDFESKMGEISGILNISSSSIPGEYILPSEIRKFKEKYSKVDFNISITNSSRAIDDIVSHKCDFAAIGFKLSKSQKEEVDSILIAHDELYFVADINHDLLKLDSIKLSDIFDYPFILREQGSATRKAFESSDYFKDNINIQLSLDSNQSILSALKNSDYISILSKYTLERFIKVNDSDSVSGLKILRPINFQPIKRDFHLLCSRNKTLSRSGKLFWEFLKNEVQ